MRNSWKKYAERGSMMVEALAMLGLITMVTPVLYKKAAERTTELQDINTASQMRTISNALDAYIADHYKDLSEEALGTVAIANEEILPYLPYGFDIGNSKLFDSYTFTAQNELVNQGQVNEHSAITGTVLAKARNDVPMIRAAKIASMVGANGGVVQGDKIQGVQGGWGGNLSDFFGDVSDVKTGSLAVSSVHAVTSSGGGASGEIGSEHVLYRDDSKGIEYNTMQTALYMGGNDLAEVSNIIAADGTVAVNGDLAVVAKENGNGGNLNVSGGATVENLLSAGAANIADVLKVNLDNNHKVEINGTTNITGDTTITSGDNSIAVSATDNSIKGTTNITGDTTIKTSETGAVVAVTGDNIDMASGKDGSIKLHDKNNEKSVVLDPNSHHYLVVNKGAKIIGGAADVDVDPINEADYAVAVDGSILVKNNARVNGNMRLDGQLTADKIYGNTAIGGGLINPDVYNFEAKADEVVVRGNKFRVGNRIDSSDDNVKLGWANGDDASASVENVVFADQNSVLLHHGNPGGRNSGSYVSADATGATVYSDNEVKISAVNGATIGVGNTKNKTLFSLKETEAGLTLGDADKIRITSSSTVLHGGGSGADGSSAPYMALENGDFKVGADNLYVDADDIVFDTKAAVSNEDDKDRPVRTSGVRINRQGIIDVAHNNSQKSSDTSVGRVYTHGYIRADRFLANEAWTEIAESPSPALNGMPIHYGADGNSTSKYYDAYQVNPAYTSVMHDIKLTTRGGARLSDILPDFINKGIYVLDNTYKETKGMEDWSKYQVQRGTSGQPPLVTKAPGDCPDNEIDCIASPWLGFVPAPQCPPGYSKVITISPIRWKMSQAYVVGYNDSMTIPDYLLDQGYQDAVGLSLYTSTNPDVARFGLEEASTNGGAEKHTHALASGTPLTFQTNTWLNTTVSGVRDSVTTKDVGDIRRADFLGWHAIMGFLYYGDNYEKWLKKVSPGENYSGKVVWNLFPVYNQEMAAIANVYCYFERRDMKTAPIWKWNPKFVDGGDSGSGYDQLTNFRSGFLKDNTEYNERLNDPALGYDEVW